MYVVGHISFIEGVGKYTNSKKDESNNTFIYSGCCNDAHIYYMASAFHYTIRARYFELYIWVTAVFFRNPWSYWNHSALLWNGRGTCSWVAKNKRWRLSRYWCLYCYSRSSRIGTKNGSRIYHTWRAFTCKGR